MLKDIIKLNYIYIKQLIIMLNSLKQFKNKKKCFKQLDNDFKNRNININNLKFAYKLKFINKDINYYNNYINKYNINNKDVLIYSISLNNLNLNCLIYNILNNKINNLIDVNLNLINYYKSINILLSIDVKKFNFIECKTSNLIKLQYGLYKVNTNRYDKFIDCITFINPNFIDIVYFNNDIIKIKDKNKILLKINIDLHNKVKYLYEYYIDCFINVNSIDNNIYLIVDKKNYDDFLKICNLKYKSLKKYIIDKSIKKYFKTFNSWFIDVETTKKDINKEKRIYNNHNRFYDKINDIKNSNLKLDLYKLLFNKKIDLIYDKINDMIYILFVITKKDFYLYSDNSKTSYNSLETLNSYLNYITNKDIKNKGYRLINLYNELNNSLNLIEYFISNNKDYYTDKDELEVYLQPIGIDKSKYTINSKSYFNHEIALKDASFADATCYEVATDYGNLSVGEGNIKKEKHKLIKSRVKYEWEK